MIESRIAGTGRFVKFGPARRTAAPAAARPPSASSTSEASEPPTQVTPQAAKSRGSSDLGWVSAEQARIRAGQIARLLQSQLELTEAERESAQQYYERVLTTGVAEPLPSFLKDKLDEWERRIAAREGEPAAGDGVETGNPPSNQFPAPSESLDAARRQAEQDAQAGLGQSLENAAGKSFGVKGINPDRKDESRNPRYWEEGPFDKKGQWTWVLKPGLSDQEILDAFADTQSKAAGTACANEMLCRRASSIVVINGFIDFFNKQPPAIRKRGLRWIVNVLRTVGGNIEDAMEYFTETIADGDGLDPKNIRAGDQVHFSNPIEVEEGSGGEGKNVIAHGPDSFSNPYASDPVSHPYSEIQTEIQGRTKPPRKPDLDKIIVDEIRRPVLPHWYTER